MTPARRATFSAPLPFVATTTGFTSPSIRRRKCWRAARCGAASSREPPEDLVPRGCDAHAEPRRHPHVSPRFDQRSAVLRLEVADAVGLVGPPGASEVEEAVASCTPR